MPSEVATRYESCFRERLLMNLIENPVNKVYAEAEINLIDDFNFDNL